MNYYTRSAGGEAVFECSPGSGKITAPLKGALTLKSAPAGFPPGYPAYEVITVNGITDIVEHRKMEPYFFMTDDPAVWKELTAPANSAPHRDGPEASHVGQSSSAPARGRER